MDEVVFNILFKIQFYSTEPNKEILHAHMSYAHISMCETFSLSRANLLRVLIIFILYGITVRIFEVRLSYLCIDTIYLSM